MHNFFLFSHMRVKQTGDELTIHRENRIKRTTHPYSDTQDNHKVNHNNGDICGVVKNHGVCCIAPYVGESKIISRHRAERGTRGQECCWSRSSLTEAPCMDTLCTFGGGVCVCVCFCTCYIVRTGTSFF